MNIEELRAYCLSLKNAEEAMPFGPDILIFRVGGKIFLICGLDNSPLQFNVKCDPEKAIELRERYNWVIPGYHMSKKHWNTIIINGSISEKLIHQWITDSYNLVISGLSKAEQKRLKEM
jgi:predicted DNA-binding protein (MmcQ/YjbR family)